jgi:predicted acylesterase/phospholipase RssA
METEIIVALLGLIGTLSGSFLGVLTASRMTAYRLEQLEQRVNKHNQVIERTYILEGQMQEVRHEISALKAYHKP